MAVDLSKTVARCSLVRNRSFTGGRVIFGVGRGYHTREVEVFGAPMLDADANRELFEEQVEIIFKAFNEESFSHQGKHGRAKYFDFTSMVPSANAKYYTSACKYVGGGEVFSQP